eukprot:239681_1
MVNYNGSPNVDKIHGYSGDGENGNGSQNIKYIFSMINELNTYWRSILFVLKYEYDQVKQHQEINQLLVKVLLIQLDQVIKLFIVNITCKRKITMEKKKKKKKKIS